MVYIFIRQDASNHVFFLQAERGYGAVCYKQLVASFKELRGIQRPLPHAQSGCDIVILQPD